MSKEREVSCIYYEYEGSCLKGREGTFRKACQTCNKYEAKKGSIPARKNLKRQKIEEIKRNDMKQMMQSC